MMQIVKAQDSDFREISGLIMREFPYMNATPEKLRERTGRKNYFIYKAVANKELAGFVDFEIGSSGELGKLNGLEVKEKFRARGIGRELLKFAVEFMQGAGCRRIQLLVKEKNEKAKALYREFGFEFVGMYSKRLDNSLVEIMELDLGNENELRYVG